MNERIIRDTRLLEALEFIDDEYIASAARYKMKYEAQPAEPPKMTWRTPLKHWKSLAALAACILLLSIASPLVGYIAQVITDWGAAAGVGTTEEVSDAITDENGVPYTYPMFVDDLEPLTVEEMLEINELWFKRAYERTYHSTYKAYLSSGYSESEAHAWAEKIAAREAYCLDKHSFFNELYYYDSRYYGKINDCVILASVGMDTLYWIIDVAGYKFAFPSSSTIYVIKDNVIYDIKEAYDLGYLTNEQIGLLAERHEAYQKFAVEWEYEMNKKYYNSEEEFVTE